MNPCPQCGASLGEGATGCASCGWSSSRRKFWIILGSIVGVLALLCCGVVGYFVNMTRGIVADMQENGTPALLALYRLQVVREAVRSGALPKTLEEATRHPVETENGDTFDFKIENEGQQGTPVDSWMHAVRYEPKEDGTFRILSAGPDGQFGNEDDLSIDGSASDDQEACFDLLESRVKEIAKKVTEGMPAFMRPEEKDLKMNISRPRPVVPGGTPVDGDTVPKDAEGDDKAAPAPVDDADDGSGK